MELIFVKQDELEPLAHRMLEDLPNPVAITPWRARSQARNPFVRKGDTLMIYGRTEEGKLAGFTGLLPTPLNGREEERIFWVSCWFALPQFRGGKIAVPLLNETLRITGSRIIHTDIQKKTADYLEKLGDFSIRSREGVLLRMRSSLHNRAAGVRPEGFRGRIAQLAATSRMLKIWDRSVNAFMNIRIRRGIVRHRSDATIESFEFPSAGQLDYIREKSKNEFIRPDKKLIEWWMKDGWVIKKEKRYASLGKRYYFSAFAESFRLEWYEIRKDGKRIGIALLNFRDGTVRTPYLWYEKDGEDVFFTALYNDILAKRRNKVLLTFHEAFAAYVIGRNESWLTFEKHVRYSAITGALARTGGDKLGMQDGDGDNLFT